MVRNNELFPLILIGGFAAWWFLGRQTSATVPRSPVSTGSVPRPTTQRGTTFVKWYQSSLNKLMGCSLAVDGIHGPLTSACVARFQSVWGLTPTGNVNSETEYYIHSALGEPGYVEQPYPGSAATEY